MSPTPLKQLINWMSWEDRVCKARLIGEVKCLVAAYCDQSLPLLLLASSSWSLEIYGSYATGTDDPNESDIDCCFCCRYDDDEVKGGEAHETTADAANRRRSEFLAGFRDYLAAATSSEMHQQQRQQHSISRVMCVLGAKVPVLSFRYHGGGSSYIDVDMTYAEVSSNMTYAEECNNASSSSSSDSSSALSLAGIKATREILSCCLLLAPPSLETFVVCVRYLKMWAKARGIYGAKLGYFSGVQLCIMVVKLLQTAATAAAAASASAAETILRRFFVEYGPPSSSSSHRWPIPVRIGEYYWKCSSSSSIGDDGGGKQEEPTAAAAESSLSSLIVWNPIYNPVHRAHVMPVLTPVYPFVNVAANVTNSTFERIMVEMDRAAASAVAATAEKQQQQKTKKWWAWIASCDSPEDNYFFFDSSSISGGEQRKRKKKCRKSVCGLRISVDAAAATETPTEEAAAAAEEYVLSRIPALIRALEGVPGVRVAWPRKCSSSGGKKTPATATAAAAVAEVAIWVDRQKISNKGTTTKSAAAAVAVIDASSAVRKWQQQTISNSSSNVSVESVMLINRIDNIAAAAAHDDEGIPPQQEQQ